MAEVKDYSAEALMRKEKESVLNGPHLPQRRTRTRSNDAGSPGGDSRAAPLERNREICENDFDNSP